MIGVLKFNFDVETYFSDIKLNTNTKYTYHSKKKLNSNTFYVSSQSKRT